MRKTGTTRRVLSHSLGEIGGNEAQSVALSPVFYAQVLLLLVLFPAQFVLKTPLNPLWW